MSPDSTTMTQVRGEAAIRSKLLGFFFNQIVATIITMLFFGGRLGQSCTQVGEESADG